MSEFTVSVTAGETASRP